MRRADTLIVGGGPAGTAAAIALSAAGHRPLLIERSRETADALCGGFLSWTTLARLERLGVAIDRLGGQRIDRLRLFGQGRSATAPLPAPALGLSRRSLDAALLTRATEAGAGIERGIAARACENGKVRSDGGEIAFDRLILATGKHDLRGLPRPHARDVILGLRWRLDPGPALDELVDSAIELHLFRGGYAGLLRQENGANLCVAVRRARLDEAGGRPDLLLAAIASECSALGERLAAARAVGPAQAIAHLPYGWRAKASSDSVYRVGDQAGVIPSLAGEGIAIALASGVASARAVCGGQAEQHFQRRLGASLRRPILAASALWHGAALPFGPMGMIGAVRSVPGLATLAARLTRIR